METNNNYITTSEVECEVGILTMLVKLAAYFAIGVVLATACCGAVDAAIARKRRKSAKKA